MDREILREILTTFAERLGYEYLEDEIEDYLSELEDEGVLATFVAEE
jgi:hypothetical protein